VKHLYFDGLRQALSKLTDAGVQKMVPQACDFANTSVDQFMPAKPPYPKLSLDSYQRRALFTILNCSPGAPVLVTGPFGTGKTRLLVRAAYEILRIPGNRVLMCAHHQNSVDTFIDYIGEISWRKKIVRIVLNNGYIVKNKPKYPQFFKARKEIQNVNKYDLVATTLGTSHRLNSLREFTHILIDEGAQTREPETIGPLCFATKRTKVVIAGDHLQVQNSIIYLSMDVILYSNL
jgi:superfamily I DNA and RNA helicase